MPTVNGFLPLQGGYSVVIIVWLLAALALTAGSPVWKRRSYMGDEDLSSCRIAQRRPGPVDWQWWVFYFIGEHKIELSILWGGSAQSPAAPHTASGFESKDWRGTHVWILERQDWGRRNLSSTDLVGDVFTSNVLYLKGCCFSAEKKPGSS